MSLKNMELSQKQFHTSITFMVGFVLGSFALDIFRDYQENQKHASLGITSQVCIDAAKEWTAEFSDIAKTMGATTKDIQPFVQHQGLTSTNDENTFSGYFLYGISGGFFKLPYACEPSIDGEAVIFRPNKQTTELLTAEEANVLLQKDITIKLTLNYLSEDADLTKK